MRTVSNIIWIQKVKQPGEREYLQQKISIVNKLRGRGENTASRKQAQGAINKEYSENEKKILGIKNKLLKLKCSFKIKLGNAPRK